jgi:predicted Ser/Thr protein kinase
MMPSPSRVESAARGERNTARLELAARFPPGMKIGPYEVMRVLGRGAMGVVLLARHDENKREVALKLMSVPQDDDMVERFKREAEAIAKLEHPWVVRLYEQGTTVDGMHWFAMEFVQGSSLDQVIKRERPSYLEGARIIAKVAQALDYAHGRGVIHRDVKPANILLDQKLNPKITDFGLARIGGKASLTTEGTIVGTPLYLAPEIARGDRASRKADIYSLGATLYELATGRPPYEGRDAQQILGRLLDAPPRPPRAVDARIPASLEIIIARAMERDPEQRFESMRHMAAELERFASERPLQISGRGGAFAVRSGSITPVILAGVFLVATLIGGIVISERGRKKALDQLHAEQSLRASSGPTTAKPAVPTADDEAVRLARDRDVRGISDLKEIPSNGGPTAESNRRLEEAMKEVSTGHPFEARNAIEQALALAPADPRLHFQRGRLMAPDDPDEAERELTMVIAWPDVPPEGRAWARLERSRVERTRGTPAWTILADTDLRVAYGMQGWSGRARAGGELALARAWAGDLTQARKLMLELAETKGDDHAVVRLAEAVVLRKEKPADETWEEVVSSARSEAQTDDVRRLADETFDRLKGR